MSRDDAKKALEAIKTLLDEDEDEYLEDLCITIIENSSRRAVIEYKKYVKDQQENAIEMWRLVDSRNGDRLGGDYDNKNDAEMNINRLREEYPNMGYYNYEPRLFREVMDND